MKAAALTLIFVMYASSAYAEEATTSSEAEQTHMKYTVSDGDTLGSIALRFQVALADVRAWNKLETDHVAVGDELIVRSKTTIKTPTRALTKPKKRRVIRTHKVRRGDTYERIGKRYKVTIKQLKRWNPRINPRRLQIGQRIRLNAVVSLTVPKVAMAHIKRHPNRSVSWGKANYGRLYNGITLSSTDALDVRNEERAWGTRHTIRMLEAAAADVKARWPDAKPLHVGDISHPDGGYMSKHKSHQSGRDADVSYYHRGNVHLPGFIEMDSETLDAVKTWHMFKTLIDTGAVEYIFVNYSLQKILYEYAVSIGYPPEDLKSIMQYPRGRGAGGIIRHSRGHGNHFHIRFRCDASDSYCQ